jgi:DNA-binding FadR family transcriptional regulator
MSTGIAYQIVAQALRHEIISGQLGVGDRLPSEAELCEHFGVSRSTIREALRMLTSQRLISTVRGQGGGSTVASLDHDEVTDMLADAIHLLTNGEGASVAELLEARELLEAPTARLAATRRTEGQLQRLRATIPASLDGLPARKIFQFNRAFHDELLEMAHNRLLGVVTEPLSTVVERRFHREKADQTFWTRVMGDHLSILKAVEAGDGDLAARRMVEHLAHMRRVYQSIDVLAPPKNGRKSRTKRADRIRARV